MSLKYGLINELAISVGSCKSQQSNLELSQQDVYCLLFIVHCYKQLLYSEGILMIGSPLFSTHTHTHTHTPHIHPFTPHFPLPLPHPHPFPPPKPLTPSPAPPLEEEGEDDGSDSDDQKGGTISKHCSLVSSAGERLGAGLAWERPLSCASGEAWGQDFSHANPAPRLSPAPQGRPGNKTSLMLSLNFAAEIAYVICW